MKKNIGALFRLFIMINLFALVLLSMPEQPVAVEDSIVHNATEYNATKYNKSSCESSIKLASDAI